MANQRGKVYLGYEDETIGENNHKLLNYTINKIGGTPDWPPFEKPQFNSKCPLCGLYRPLLVQCYAPIENSVYHRTLYVFACINPNCWIQSESWLCIRSQVQDKPVSDSEPQVIVPMPNADNKVMWCNGAEEWDEIDNGDMANGNINIDNIQHPNNGIQRNSDDEEESNSFEVESVELAKEFGNLQVFDAHNANMSPIQGAVGAIALPVAAAELEGGDEPDLVTIDTPTAPTNNVEALLHQTAELSPDLRSRLMCGSLQFIPKFIYVEEENKTSMVDHQVAELLSKYKRENDLDVYGSGEQGAGGGGCDDELYEDTAPLHGDKLFHAFLMRLRNNPGQILRYSRDQPPLLGAPLPSTASTPESPGVPAICLRCGSQLICELQLLPEFTEALRLLPNNITLTHLHFLSVFVFTCSQSCWQPTDTIVKETVIFQPEVV